MNTQPIPVGGPARPVAAWKRDWEERVAGTAPSQLSVDHGPSKLYWARPEQALQWRLLQRFGLWQLVVLDTILAFISELLFNIVLAVIVVFTIAVNNPILHNGGSISDALRDASNTGADWLTSPLGLAAGAAATQIGIVLLLHLRVVRQEGFSWQDIGFGKAMRSEPTKAIAIGLAFGLLAFLAGEVLLNVMSLMKLDVSEQQNGFKSVEHALPFEMVPFVITTVLTAPLAEEAFFRGYALRALTIRYGFPTGLIVSSTLFAVLHLAGGVGWVVVPLFVVGLILGTAYARTGNLLTNITAHALNNVIGVILLYATR